MGLAYEEGKGVYSNYTKAIEYYEKAGNLNNSYALVYLGQIFEAGKIVDKNLTKAFEFYDKAAKFGNLNASIYLDICYDKGDLVEQYFKKEIFFKKITLYSSSWYNFNIII